MQPKVGTTLVSAVDPTTAVVIKWGAGDVEVTCGGVPMGEKGAPAAAGDADPSQQDGTQMGKRYTDEGQGVELLVTKAGQGTLAVAGSTLAIKQANALPASD